MNLGESEEHCLPPEVEMHEAEQMRLQEEMQEQEQRGIVEATDNQPNPMLPAVVQPEPQQQIQAGTDPKDNRAIEIGQALLPAFQKASTLQVEPEQERMLRKPFPDSDVEIRPDGLLYIPHMLIRERLIDAFGAGKWTVVRRREWVDKQNGNEILYAEWVMLVNGVAVGETVTDHPLTGRMTYGEALESTEGEAVRRISAKRFGCGSQVWMPGYIRTWMAKHAVKLGGNWSRRGFDVQVPSDTVPANKVAPAPVSAPKASVVEETKEEKLAKWRKMLEPLGQYAIDYLREKKQLLETEDLSNLSWVNLPKTKGEANAILDAIRLQMDGGMGQPPNNLPELKPDTEHEPFYRFKDVVIPWRDVKVPFGKDKDTNFGNLPKNTLWWWCCKYESKPWIGKDGQEHAPSGVDIALRRMLDELKNHYQFTDNRP